MKLDKTIGTWVCNNDECKNEMKSFLYNSLYHIPNNCTRCTDGKMIEDESRREKQTPAAFTGGKAKEEAWLKSAPPLQAAAALLGDDPVY
jgi:hypothetical protein